MPSPPIYYADMPRGRPLQDILAANLRAVMTERRLKQTHVAARARIAGASVDQRTVGRVREGKEPATVATLDAIAMGIGIDAWQLLKPDLDPKTVAATAIAPLSNAEFAQLEAVKAAIRDFTPAQRDLFVGDDVMRNLARDNYPSTQMRGDWTSPHAAHEHSPPPYIKKK